MCDKRSKKSGEKKARPCQGEEDARMGQEIDETLCILLVFDMECVPSALQLVFGSGPDRTWSMFGRYGLVQLGKVWCELDDSSTCQRHNFYQFSHLRYSSRAHELSIVALIELLVYTPFSSLRPISSSYHRLPQARLCCYGLYSGPSP